MENAVCAVCGGDGDRVVIRENGYQSVRCDACGIVFVSPRPNRADMERIYLDDAAHVSSRTQLRPSLDARWHAARTVGLIRRYRTGGRLVDIGAGGGGVLLAARSRGFSVAAVEVNPVAASHLRSLGIPCTGQLEGSADIVYSRDVLSHFGDPEAEVRRMFDHLRPGGLLVMETGNIGDVHPRYYDRYQRFQYPDHLYFFGEDSLRRLLELAGFRVVRLERYSVMATLWLLRTKDRLRQGHGAPAGGPGPSTPAPAGGLRRDALGAALYVSSYQLGRVLPKRQRPQTMIVIAEKAGGSGDYYAGPGAHG